MLRRVPFPLLALCVSALVLGATWALVTPPFQAPDENAHFSYVEYLSRTGHLPGTPDRPPFSTEQFEAGLASNSDQVAGNLATKPSWDPSDWARWQAREHVLTDAQRSDSGGPVSASQNPPLYYVYEAVPAVATGSANLFTRLSWERLASMLWAVALVVFAWLLAGEVFRRNRTLQFVAAGVAGLLPMVQFVSASVTPDAMLYAMWAAVFWRGAVILKRGLTPASAAIFLALVGAACVVKATSYALLPAALLVLGIGVWRLRSAGSKVLLRLAAAGAGLVLTLGVWFFIAHQSHRSGAAQLTDAASSNLPIDHPRDFLSYVYQYYFPRVFGMGRYPFPSYFGNGVPFYDIILRGVFGEFGWSEVRFPDWLHYALIGLFDLLVIGVVWALVKLRRGIDWPLLAFFGLAALALIAGLQWTDYKMLRDSGFHTGFNQGRYLLPLAALGGVAGATVLRALPARWRPALAGAVVIGLVMLNVLSLGTVAWRFYA